MSKIAAAVAALQPAGSGKQRKLDQLLDDEDKAAVIDRYLARCGVQSICDALNEAWKQAGIDASITANPIISMLKEAGVYRTKAT